MKSKQRYRKYRKVERNGKRPCCDSCLEDVNEGFSGYDPDYCCCIHGKVVARKEPGEYITWWPDYYPGYRLAQ